MSPFASRRATRQRCRHSQRKSIAFTKETRTDSKATLPPQSILLTPIYRRLKLRIRSFDVSFAVNPTIG
ncbi:hypothetical protein MFRU_005g03030 [Monilinia fructicola]|nr:hypothetical protein MFRU_005g03030 [Monilinia fructicola]